MYIYNEIKNDDIAIEKIEEDQKHFKSKHKSKDQLDTIKNIKNLCKICILCKICNLSRYIMIMLTFV